MKKSKVLVFLFIAALWSGLSLFADNYDANLIGHVLDEKTGEHLPYVNVQIKGTAIGTVTDESGHYFLKDLPLGPQTVVFSYVGYKTLELQVNIIEQKNNELNAAIL